MMKLILRGVVALVFIVLVASCKKDDDPAFSSLEGKWTYTTTDGKINIDFDLVKNTSGNLEVQNSKLKIDGTSAETVSIPSGITSNAITSLRFSANDSKVTYPYYILFTNVKATDDFSKMNVESGEYTFPWGTTKKFTAVVIARR